jgi:hypothetical protein
MLVGVAFEERRVGKSAWLKYARNLAWSVSRGCASDRERDPTGLANGHFTFDLDAPIVTRSRRISWMTSQSVAAENETHHWSGEGPFTFDLDVLTVKQKRAIRQPTSQSAKNTMLAKRKTFHFHFRLRHINT